MRKMLKISFYLFLNVFLPFVIVCLLLTIFDFASVYTSSSTNVTTTLPRLQWDRTALNFFGDIHNSIGVMIGSYVGLIICFKSFVKFGEGKVNFEIGCQHLLFSRKIVKENENIESSVNYLRI